MFLRIPREITGETGQTGKRTTVLLQELERNHPTRTRTWRLGNPQCGVGGKSAAVRGGEDVFGKWGPRRGRDCEMGQPFRELLS